MTLVVAERLEPERTPSEAILRRLPKLADREEWSMLTRTEQDTWTIALGTATNWFSHQARSPSAPHGLIASYCELLEEIASSEDPETVNAVVVSALEQL